MATSIAGVKCKAVFRGQKTTFSPFFKTEMKAVFFWYHYDDIKLKIEIKVAITIAISIPDIRVLSSKPETLNWVRVVRGNYLLLCVNVSRGSLL